PHFSAFWVWQCERLLKQDQRLTAILAGLASPASALERLELADLCPRYKKFYAAAARFYAGAFADGPLAERLPCRRYNAACAAALAGCGRGADAAGLTDADRARLRWQARDWLRAGLAAWQKRAGDAANREQVRTVLTHWQQDPDLTGVR